MAIAYLSIGSNLGNRYDNCIRGRKTVDTLDQTRVVATSPFYRTEPVGFLDQAWFVNGALKIETRLDPFELIDGLKKIELLLGQGEKEVRFGPRIIDLDIILYGERVVQTDRLILPHPRMHKRCFVLKPLCDIASGIVHPTMEKTMEQLLLQIENNPGQEVRVYVKGDA
ncbi:2-amino-4-hydroxy-6-hydroxymethyldihydropteridine diphosphokinase [Desulforapulum autotrophicum]|nr:2-amino-4-hydroxy-6-hydroxymethyldihydropteridine diphosphokinase [Desulforapulum autotrophicum]